MKAPASLSELFDSPSLWRSPSSPPFRSPDDGCASPTWTIPRSTSAADPQSSPPSTPSEFEFDSLAAADVRDDPPASPKFLSSEYWAAAPPRPSAPPSTATPADDTLNTVEAAGISAPSSKNGAPLAPTSSSVRQPVIEEAHCAQPDVEPDRDIHFSPRTPTGNCRPLNPRQRPSSLPCELQANHLIDAHVPVYSGERQTISSAADASSSSEPATTFALRWLRQSRSVMASTSSSWAWSPVHAAAGDKGEEETNGSSSSKRAINSRSSKKWAFKDLLRRTVPSSKIEAHFLSKRFEAPSTSKSSSSNSRITPTSPQSSHHSKSSISSPSRSSTLSHASPSSKTTNRSPPHPSTSRHISTKSTNWEARLSQHSSTIASQAPPMSPPRSPISDHVAHYKLQKAQSHDNNKKTFLPYRQSLLACLGGSSAFPSNQLVC